MRVTSSAWTILDCQIPDRFLNNAGSAGLSTLTTPHSAATFVRSFVHFFFIFLRFGSLKLLHFGCDEQTGT
jgi:hypothetical protein